MPDFKEFSDNVASEVTVIKSAPLSFGVALLVMGIIMWRIFEWRYKYKDDLIELYKARLDGATPDEAKAKIESLERAVGLKWAPLTASEARALVRELATVEKRPLNIFYLNALGKDLALSLKQAFETAEWNVQSCAQGAGVDEGLDVGSSPTIGPVIKNAIEASTPLSVKFVPAAWNMSLSEAPSEAVYIGIGIRAR